MSSIKRLQTVKKNMFKTGEIHHLKLYFFMIITSSAAVPDSLMASSTSSFVSPVKEHIKLKGNRFLLSGYTVEW